jgi:hypothetical protein
MEPAAEPSFKALERGLESCATTWLPIVDHRRSLLGNCWRARHSGAMTPIEKCLQTLQALVKAGDIKAMGLAETAIDEFVAAHVGRDRQTDALNTLDRNLVFLRKQVGGPSAEFADVVFDYMGK